MLVQCLGFIMQDQECVAFLHSILQLTVYCETLWDVPASLDENGDGIAIEFIATERISLAPVSTNSKKRALLPFNTD